MIVGMFRCQFLPDDGAIGRIRTVDLRITNALLYQLSYNGCTNDTSVLLLHDYV